MSLAALQDWLMANKGFRTRMHSVLLASVANQFPRLMRHEDLFSQPHDWSHLLLCASILARGDRPATQEVALRIAQSVFLDKHCTVAEQGAAALVLDEMANRRAIELAERRELIKPGHVERLGISATVDWTRRTLENTIFLDSQNTLYANRFQRQFWEDVKTSSWLSASAPTSSGKSFIVLQWLGELLQSSEKCTVAYIVPTRALIQQVERDIRRMLSLRNIKDVQIDTVPFPRGHRRQPKQVLIFTQERLHYFLAARGYNVQLEALIVDEAHKIGDRQRGVLLQDVIERVTEALPDVRVIFAAPLADNPEELLADMTDGLVGRRLKSGDVTVNQNLVWLDKDTTDPKTWTMSACLTDQRVSLGLLHLDKNLSTVKGKLAHLAIACDTGEGGNLVYVNRAYDAEQTAEEIYKALEAPSERDRELGDLAELAKLVVHNDYALVRCIDRGVAFHYGNMPLILRTEIERLFEEGKIRFLVCTSTLVEGVNLPCKNLFVRGPKKGGEPMDSADFWNLAGRAGRWGQEFQGNIICIDARSEEAWKNGAPTTRGSYRMERTTDRVLKNHTELLAFLSANTPRDVAQEKPELEFVASYLIGTVLRYGSIQEAPWASRLPQERLRQISEVIETIVASLRLPHDLVLRHPGISPVAMSALLDGLHTHAGGPEELLIMDPVERDSAQRYAKIFELVGHYLAPVFGTGGRALALAILTREWMLGYPISRLVSGRLKRKKQKLTRAEADTLIRRTLEDVEEIARFQAPRYFACYADLLKLYFAEIGRSDLIEAGVDVTLMLEFGVPGGTQLALMGLGLSRTSANLLAEQFESRAADEGFEIPELPLDETRAREFLLALVAEEWELPTLVRREVEEVKRRLAN